MRYLELSLASGDQEIHPLFPIMAESEFVDGAWMLDWNVTREDTTMALFRIEGAPGEMADVLATVDVVHDFDVSSGEAEEYYVYIYSKTVPVERQLWLAFNQRRSVLIPPLEYRDGMVICRIVGSDEELRNAVDDIPDGLYVDIRRIGRFEGESDGIRGELTPRQIEAVEAGLAVGYYEIPREATAEDVGNEIGCSPSTASELLRRAESTIVSLLFDGSSPVSV